MLAVTFPRRWLCQHVAVNALFRSMSLKRLQLPRSQVIYYGIPVTDLDEENRFVVPSNGLPLCFAYVGRLVSLKGLPLILEAAHTLQMAGYNFHSRFIGDGPEQAELSG